MGQMGQILYQAPQKRIGHEWAKWAITNMNQQENIKTDGCLGKVHQLFGAELGQVIEGMNRELVT
jgi:hypothetical protein